MNSAFGAIRTLEKHREARPVPIFKKRIARKSISSNRGPDLFGFEFSPGSDTLRG
jgi:hypothetical protein